MEGSNRPSTRSRLGCLTCRQRKKKCDETLYPVCQNCDKKGLGCVWPAEKHELNKLMKQVRYVATSKEAEPLAIHGSSSRYGVSKRKKPVMAADKKVTSEPYSKKSLILERIALQQDIQETEKEVNEEGNRQLRGDYGDLEVTEESVPPITAIEPDQGVDLGQFFNSESIFEFIDEQFLG